jgi:hypothetical protein
VKRRCAYCGSAADGAYSIHRDGFCEGPEVPLCNACGATESPTLREIWSRIGRSPACLECDEDILPGDERVGSFHAWCNGQAVS